MKAEVYFILGHAGSGRRMALADMAEFLVGEGRSVTVFHSPGEPFADTCRPSGVEFSASVINDEEPPSLPEGEGTVVFVMGDGRLDPLDQISAWHRWCLRDGFSPTRILTFINALVAHGIPAMADWYEACIHFSDVALLRHLNQTDPRWQKEYVLRFERDFSPCLLVLLKNDQVENPWLVIDHEARRVTRIFDQVEAFDLEEDEDGAEWESDDLPQIGQLPSATVDPWLQQHSSGARIRRLPDHLPLLQSFYETPRQN